MKKITNMTQADESVKQLLQNLRARMKDEDIQRIGAAYQLAAKAHNGQTRKSGEPYIIHPIAVARIVAEEMELGANPIIAAFLHDVVEDTSYTIDDIRERFGDDVAFLVDVVTKKKNELPGHSKQVDNYQQMLASVKYDIRALLLKLADRLHNMRTLSSMRPDKQMKIAGETDYFYAPLANRLGMYHTKTELENLSFQYRCPREYASIYTQLEHERMERQDEIARFTAKVQKLLSGSGIVVRTEVRYRMPYSIWRKMQNKGCDFNHVDYKHYVRIIYTTETPQEEKMLSLRIYATLTDHFKERPGSLANYIDAPKENGYQSFHVKLLNAQGEWEETHISSERMVRASRLGCTAERTEENLQAWIDKFRDVLQDIASHSGEIDFMDGVTSSFYYDDILVFTPEGRGIILPKGATALDFAYEIHSEVGNHAFFARINGKLTSVTTQLNRGDCVEIGTRDEACPHPEWLDHVLTYKAKRNLRSYFAHLPKLEYKRCPLCHPLPGDEVVGFSGSDGSLTLHKRDCPTAIRLASQQGDSISCVNFTESKNFLYPVRIRIRGIDRYHLLSDMVACVTERLHLGIEKLVTETIDNIVECTVYFSVHSADELHEAISSISRIPGIDEVHRVSEPAT
ncbi:MAG: HD domain-containing protein [Prevotellaceae bacterium]|nr:HD domain-containing protein [Prevotellaceae bacterium]